MKRFYGLLIFACWLATVHADPLRVVTTLPDYRVFAQAIGGTHVRATAIVRGDQDAHFIRPKPSFVSLVQDADVLIDTGLDLELWIPTIINKSGNTRIRSGQPGYVSVSQGIPLLEKPQLISRSEGGVHIYGNPHLTCSPLNMKVVVRNIAYGLAKNDPAHRELYLQNMKRLQHQLDVHLFGERLVTLIGGKLLCDLAAKNRLLPFLEKHRFRGEPLIASLGGWYRKMLPLRGVPLVTYHKNWIYFIRLFELKEAGTVEPKPGIPPSVRHVSELMQMMRSRQIKIILAANYFDEHRVRTIAADVGAYPVIVPLYVDGVPGVEDYFRLFDYWVSSLVKAATRAGIYHTR